MPTFECLYFLDNFYLAIVEVKRNGLAESATAAEKFHWIRYDRETRTIVPLAFRSMDSAGEVEERYFEQGYLKFNAAIGTFIEKYNSAQHPLNRISCSELPEEISSAITDYLSRSEPA
ncbi:hypothetical protein [Pedobacter chinensis]|uniref:hypothetical protein n=1 Tax=Pedobacter chinensis TaxID=2282421 RepID=UPI0011C081B2|nr:hypothetical protein [Pedobacter chinensis]